MDTGTRLRAMASLCRQTAAHHPDRSWKLLAEAECWEHSSRRCAARTLVRICLPAPSDRR